MCGGDRNRVMCVYKAVKIINREDYPKSFFNCGKLLQFH